MTFIFSQVLPKEVQERAREKYGGDCSLKEIKRKIGFFLKQSIKVFIIDKHQ